MKNFSETPESDAEKTYFRQKVSIVLADRQAKEDFAAEKTRRKKQMRKDWTVPEANEKKLDNGVIVNVVTHEPVYRPGFWFFVTGDEDGVTVHAKSDAKGEHDVVLRQSHFRTDGAGQMQVDSPDGCFQLHAMYLQENLSDADGIDAVPFFAFMTNHGGYTGLAGKDARRMSDEKTYNEEIRKKCPPHLCRHVRDWNMRRDPETGKDFLHGRLSDKERPWETTEIRLPAKKLCAEVTGRLGLVHARVRYDMMIDDLDLTRTDSCCLAYVPPEILRFREAKDRIFREMKRQRSLVRSEDRKILRIDDFRRRRRT